MSVSLSLSLKIPTRKHDENPGNSLEILFQPDQRPEYPGHPLKNPTRKHELEANQNAEPQTRTAVNTEKDNQIECEISENKQVNLKPNLTPRLNPKQTPVRSALNTHSFPLHPNPRLETPNAKQDLRK